MDLFYLCLSLAYCHVCFLHSCGHFLGKGRSLGSLVRDFFLCFVTFPCSVLGKVWSLIASIPGLCLRSYCIKNYSNPKHNVWFHS